MVLARALTLEEYGIYVLVLSLIMAVMGVQRALVSMPYTIHARNRSDQALQTYTGSAFIHHLVLAGLCATASLLLAGAFLETNGAGCISFAIAVAAMGILARDFVRSYFLSSLSIQRCIVAGVSINASQLAVLALLFVGKGISLCSAFLMVGACSWFRRCSCSFEVRP